MRANPTQIEGILAAARAAVKEYEEIKAWHISLKADIDRACGTGGKIPSPLDLALKDDSPMDFAMGQLTQWSNAIESNPPLKA